MEPCCAAAPSAWEDVRQLVVFGLGSLESGPVSRHQAAMALALKAVLPGLAGLPRAYDPVFSEVDCDALTALQFKVLSAEEARPAAAEVPTLLFLPHCESEFTSAVIRANAESVQTLRSVAVLGNSFAASHERWCRGGVPHSCPERCPASVMPSVAGARLLEVPVPEAAYPVTGAFNDMALHVFATDDAAQ